MAVAISVGSNVQRWNWPAARSFLNRRFFEGVMDYAVVASLPTAFQDALLLRTIILLCCVRLSRKLLA